MLLTELKPGTHGIITDLSKIDRLIRRRLLDLGVVEGERVQYKSAMPFGGPYMLEICGQCIGIRRKEAMHISVECE
ncbi:FeoA family protein [Terrilactibacillus sp. S3-3]|nr:FeoA family protein [Terrilactibacillus sp. S3-3]